MTLNSEHRDFIHLSLRTTGHTRIQVDALVQTKNKLKCAVLIRLLMKFQMQYYRLTIQPFALPHDC